MMIKLTDAQYKLLKLSSKRQLNWLDCKGGNGRALGVLKANGYIKRLVITAAGREALERHK